MKSKNEKDRQAYLGQDIQEWTKENLWKTAFKNLKRYGSDTMFEVI